MSYQLLQITEQRHKWKKIAQDSIIAPRNKIYKCEHCGEIKTGNTLESKSCSTYGDKCQNEIHFCKIKIVDVGTAKEIIEKIENNERTNKS